MILIEPGTWLQKDIMTFQETLESLSPTARAPLQTLSLLPLMGRDGRIVDRGIPGPFGFIVAELEQAIARYLAEAG